MRLDGKVAIITGAAEGIGRGCAEAFAREGARVIVDDLNRETGEETIHALLAAGAQAAFVQVDVAEPDSVEQLVRRTVELYGHLDVLVSNAGIGGRKFGDGPTHQCSVDAWDKIMQVNLRGTFLACKYALPELIKRGGSIIT